MNPFALLSAGRTVLLDGGTGSELRRRGLDLSARCWSAVANLEHGELLEAIHRDYIAAGADIVTANTFGTARFVLSAEGLEHRCLEINGAAIAAARRAVAAAGRRVAVAASLSCMPPAFDRRAWPAADDEQRAYAELADCFAAHGVDLVLLEMMQDAAHAGRAARAVQSAGLPFVAGLSCRLAGPPAARRPVAFDDPALDIEPALDAILPFGPAAIAIMHTPVDAMLPALEWLGVRWRGPIGAYAEIPYPEDPDAPGAMRLEPAAYAGEARRWLAGGARLLGGCCGTTPAHIAALAPLAVD